MLDKLEFILALAQEQHFGRATNASRVSQPTLSAASNSSKTRSVRGAGKAVSGARLGWPEGQQT